MFLVLLPASLALLLAFEAPTTSSFLISFFLGQPGFRIIIILISSASG